MPENVVLQMYCMEIELSYKVEMISPFLYT